MLLCPLSSTNATPFAVSVVTSHCRRPRNLLRVVDLRQRSVAVNFSVCVPPMFGEFDAVQDLVEFVEVNRVLGAQRFQLYVSSVGARVSRCLHEYVSRDVVQLQAWTLPPDVSRIIYYHGQILAISECLYRLMHRTRYVVVQDLDEFVVPMQSDDWQSMLDAINRNARTDSDRIASYNFRNRFFPTEFPPKASNSTSALADSGDGRRFRTLSVVKADKKLFRFTERSKVMARPERVLMYHVHLILSSSLVRAGDVNVNANARYGQLFHYRRGFRVANTTTVSRMKDFERLILRRLYVATAAICLTGDYLYPPDDVAR